MRTLKHFPALRILIAAMPLTACVPYPVYKTLQPSAKITVRGQGNMPLANAEATLIAGAHPSRFEKSRETKRTRDDGTASFKAVRELRVELMALHGWEEFYWNWCVRKEGYATYLTNRDGAGEFQTDQVVQLQPGQSRPCPVPYQ